MMHAVQLAVSTAIAAAQLLATIAATLHYAFTRHQRKDEHPWTFKQLERNADDE